jgi:hypothetical protein
MGIIIPANDYEASELAFNTLLNVLPVNAKIEEVVSEDEIIVDMNTTNNDASWALGLKGPTVLPYGATTTVDGYIINPSTTGEKIVIDDWSKITEEDMQKYHSAKIGLVIDDELVELYNLAKSQGKIELAMSILMEIKNNK